MSPDATLREIKAVDSGNMLFGNHVVKFLENLLTVTQLLSLLFFPENQKNLLSDAWRMSQVSVILLFVACELGWKH